MKQRLQEQEAAVASEGSNMAHASAKVQTLEYDLGNLSQSLQVSQHYLINIFTAVPCVGNLTVLIHATICLLDDNSASLQICAVQSPAKSLLM